MSPRAQSALAQRAKTRAWIVQCAIPVFAEMGPDRPVIDDFTKAAGIARGTFYNYFQTTRELLDACLVVLSDDIIASIAPAVDGETNPVVRLATAAWLYYRRATVDPLFGAFLRAMPNIGRLAAEYGRRDLEEAIEAGLIRVTDIDLAEAIVLGLMVFSLRIPRADGDSDGRALEVVRATLAALGATPALIQATLRALRRKMPSPDRARTQEQPVR